MLARSLAAGLLSFALAWALLTSRPPTATPTTPALVQAVEAIGITVSDLDRALDFYMKVLFFEKVSEATVAGSPWDRLQGVPEPRMRVARLRLGEEQIELTEYLAPRGRPLPSDSRSHDRWFQHVAIIVNDIDQAYLWLRRHRVERISPAPQRLPDWNPNAGGIQAFYFKDPDGHPLEILQFPSDKGDARWQQRTDRVFLGIDHTAIVAGDTERSLAFYRDALGMRVAGRSENWGPEQERLNNVAGARLRITTLRAGAGPGIELLEYLHPRDGRGFPEDARPNDVLHWQSVLSVRELPGAARALRARQFAFVSPDVVDLPEATLGFRRALGLRDPDGHAVQLRSR